VAYSNMSDYSYYNVLHERHGSSNAPKVALLSHDVLLVRLWRHLVQRLRRGFHANLHVLAYLVLWPSRALFGTSHRLHEHAVLYFQLACSDVVL
jgi:hypothetical protein